MNKENKFNFSGPIPQIGTKERIFFEFLKSFDDSKSFVGFNSKTIINLLLNYGNDEFIMYVLLHTLWKGQPNLEITSFAITSLLKWDRRKIGKVFDNMEQEHLIKVESFTKGYKITCLQDFRRNRADNCEIPIGRLPYDYCHECSAILNKEFGNSEQGKSGFGNSEQHENQFGNSEQFIPKFENAKQEQFGNSEQPKPKFENAKQSKFDNPEQFDNTEHAEFGNAEHTKFDNPEHLKKPVPIFAQELSLKFPKFGESIKCLQDGLERRDINIEDFLNWPQAEIIDYAEQHKEYTENNKTDYLNFFKYRKQFENERILLK